MAETNKIKVPSGLNIVAGIWLILSPFILGFSYINGALWNNIIVGAAILVLAAIREWGKEAETTWASWGNLILGIWLFLSPFIVGFSSDAAALWNNIIVGIAVTILAGWSGRATFTAQTQA